MGPIVEKSAGARIHGGSQHKARGKSKGHGRAGDAHSPILQRLAHDFEHVAGKFWQFIEEKYAVVGERHFAGPRNNAAGAVPVRAVVQRMSGRV